MSSRISNWDKAYSNSDSVKDANQFVERWPKASEDFRKSAKCRLDIDYGPEERQNLDLFEPDSEPKGLFMFVHGGYWYRFDKSYWSHLAAGPLANGWMVAMPSYTLTPAARVSDITKEISAAINKASELVSGPIVLCGHSAGGHLVTRQICEDSGLKAETFSRIVRVISVSGVHDLRPVLRLELNNTIGLDPGEASAESPALLKPKSELPVDCVVGADELPEFLRQNALLANVWLGLGCETSCHEIQGTHHFNVIEDLQAKDGLICRLANQGL